MTTKSNLKNTNLVTRLNIAKDKSDKRISFLENLKGDSSKRISVRSGDLMSQRKSFNSFKSSDINTNNININENDKRHNSSIDKLKLISKKSYIEEIEDVKSAFTKTSKSKSIKSFSSLKNSSRKISSDKVDDTKSKKMGSDEANVNETKQSINSVDEDEERIEAKSSSKKISIMQKRRMSYIKFRDSISNKVQRKTITEFENYKSIIEKGLYKTEINLTQSNLKKVEISLAILGFIYVLLSIVDTQLHIIRTENYLSDKFKADIFYEQLDKNECYVLETITRTANILISIAMIVLVWYKYYYLSSIKKLNNEISKFENSFYNSDFIYLICETVISGLFYPPCTTFFLVGKVNQYKYYIMTNSILTLITFSKLTFVLNIYKYFSSFMSLEVESICNKYNVEFGLEFSLKSEFKSRPFKVMTIFFLLFICIFSFTIRTFENSLIIDFEYVKENNLPIPYYNETSLLNFKNEQENLLKNYDETDEEYVLTNSSIYKINIMLDYAKNTQSNITLIQNHTISQLDNKGTRSLKELYNCFWFTFTTITTVGYGDVIPKTIIGKLITFVLCILGIVFVSMVTASIQSLIQFTSDDLKAYFLIKKDFFQQTLKVNAQKIIIDLLRINYNKRTIITFKTNNYVIQNDNKSNLLFSKLHKGENKTSNINIIDMFEKEKTKSKLAFATNEKSNLYNSLNSDYNQTRLSIVLPLLSQLKMNIYHFKNKSAKLGNFVHYDEVFLQLREKIGSDLVKMEFNINYLISLKENFKNLNISEKNNIKIIKRIKMMQSQIYKYIKSLHNEINHANKVGLYQIIVTNPSEKSNNIEDTQKNSINKVYDTIFENTIKNSDSIKMVEIKNSETNKNENDDIDDQIKLKVKIRKNIEENTDSNDVDGDSPSIFKKITNIRKKDKENHFSEIDKKCYKFKKHSIFSNNLDYFSDFSKKNNRKNSCNASFSNFIDLSSSQIKGILKGDSSMMDDSLLGYFLLNEKNQSPRERRRKNFSIENSENDENKTLSKSNSSKFLPSFNSKSSAIQVNNSKNIMVAKVENILNLRKKSKISNFGNYVREKINNIPKKNSSRHSTSCSPIKNNLRSQYAFSSLADMIKEFSRKINNFRERDFEDNSKNDNYSNVPEVSNELYDIDMDDNTCKYSEKIDSNKNSNKRVMMEKIYHSNKINLNLNLNIMVKNVDNTHNKSISNRDYHAYNNYTIAESLIEDSKFKHHLNDISK